MVERVRCHRGPDRGHYRLLAQPAWHRAIRRRGLHDGGLLVHSSTSFANPAVTLGRSATDTFAGIRPGEAPAFIVASLLRSGVHTGDLLGRPRCPARCDCRCRLPLPKRRNDARNLSLRNLPYWSVISCKALFHKISGRRDGQNLLIVQVFY